MFSIIGIGEMVVILFILLPVILLVISLTDILKHDFEGNNKIVWVFVVAVLPVIGSILYFAIGRGQKIASGRKL